MLFCEWEQSELPLISQTTSKLFFPLVWPQKDEKQIVFNNTWMTNFGYSLLIYFNTFDLA
jgi:hypothetical protein